jgi:hypothetical protein
MMNPQGGFHKRSFKDFLCFETCDFKNMSHIDRMAAAFKNDSDSDSDDEIPRNFTDMPPLSLGELPPPHTIEPKPSFNEFRELLLRYGNIKDEEEISLLYRFSHLVDGIVLTIVTDIFNESMNTTDSATEEWSTLPDGIPAPLLRSVSYSPTTGISSALEITTEDYDSRELRNLFSRMGIEQSEYFTRGPEIYTRLIQTLKKIDKVQKRLQILKFRKSSKFHKENHKGKRRTYHKKSKYQRKGSKKTKRSKK